MQYKIQLKITEMPLVNMEKLPGINSNDYYVCKGLNYRLFESIYDIFIFIITDLREQH